MITIESLTAERAFAHKSDLAKVLFECVAAGASVSFLAPFPQASAEEFFNTVCGEVQAGRRILLAAFDGQTLVGTVQVITAMPPNQPHRGEIAKLLVSPAAQGQGIGSNLMVQAELKARRAGKTLLVLDTASAAAEAIYRRLGWTKAGVIPDYALMPDGTPCDTRILLESPSAARALDASYREQNVALRGETGHP